MSSCTPAEPLVPPLVVERVNGDDRERNYDLAWQEIRALSSDIKEGKYEGLADDALVIVSRMDRLATGEASELSDWQTERTVRVLQQAVAARSNAENRRHLVQLAQQLPVRFDPGEFDEARDIAIEIALIIRRIAPPVV